MWSIHSGISLQSLTVWLQRRHTCPKALIRDNNAMLMILTIRDVNIKQRRSWIMSAGCVCIKTHLVNPPLLNNSTSGWLLYKRTRQLYLIDSTAPLRYQSDCTIRDLLTRRSISLKSLATIKRVWIHLRPPLCFHHPSGAKRLSSCISVCQWARKHDIHVGESRSYHV